MILTYFRKQSLNQIEERLNNEDEECLILSFGEWVKSLFLRIKSHEVDINS